MYKMKIMEIENKKVDIDALLQLGFEEEKLGQYENALNTYKEALKIDPKSFYAFYRRGRVKAALGEYEAAIRDYNQSIALKRDNVVAFYDRGMANIALGKHESARKDFEQTIFFCPSYVAAINQLGNVEATLGNYQQAITHYNQAIKQEPEYASIIYDYIKSNPTFAETPLHNYSKTIVLDLTIEENNTKNLQTGQDDICPAKSGKDSPSSPSASPVPRRNISASSNATNKADTSKFSVLASKQRFFAILSHISDAKDKKTTEEAELTAPISISVYK